MDGAHDEAPASPDLGRQFGLEHVGVLPENPEVFFMGADRILDHSRLAVVLEHDGIEVHDLAEAVAPEFERVGLVPE